MRAYDKITEPARPKREKILYRLENEIRRFWGQKGYWKARTAMRLSYEVGSLSMAWAILNEWIEKIDRQRKANEQPCSNWVDLITQDLGKTSEVCTVGC